MAQDDLIFGKRAVIEALKGDVPIKSVLVADNIERDPMVKDIFRKAAQRDIKVEEVPRKRLDALGDQDQGSRVDGRHKDKGSHFAEHTVAHQGVIALARPFTYASLRDILAQAQVDAAEREGRALVIVADHLTDAGNLGAVIRSAESVGASGIVIPNRRAASITPKTYKSSAGAVSHIPIAQVSNIAQAIEELKDGGFWVVAATEHSDGLIWDADLTGRIALVFGNEHEGVSGLVLERSDMAVCLPQVGKISSLNVAQAATACMYEWLRQNMVKTAKSGK